VCGKPVAPPAQGNVIWNASSQGTPLEPFEGARTVSLLDTPVYVVHKSCDPEDRLGECWTPLDVVLSLNQNIFDHLRNQGEWREFTAWRERRDKRERKKPAVEFKKLSKLEPRLAALYEQAKSVRDDGKSQSFCANSIWYGYSSNAGLKPRLVELVGHRRKDDPILGTSRAYDIAYRTIYEALPACRGCGCV